MTHCADLPLFSGHPEVTRALDTRLKAYLEKSGDLARTQAVVLGAIEHLGEASNMELANYLHRGVNTITPRVFELRKLGLVVDAGKRTCSITGKTAHVWRSAVVNRANS